MATTTSRSRRSPRTPRRCCATSSSRQLAVRIGNQWFRYSLSGDREDACRNVVYKVTRLGQVKRAVPELRVEYTGTSACDHGGNGHDREHGFTDHGLVVIGIGPSGKPSGLPALVTQELSWDRLDDGPKNTFKSGLTLTWGPTGALDVGGQPPDLGPDATSAESWLGHHLLAFP